MAITEVKRLWFTCDRCDTMVEFKSEDEARRAGWTWINGVALTPRDQVLCPSDSGRLQAFLHGAKTGRGARFNAHEDIRWTEACR